MGAARKLRWTRAPKDAPPLCRGCVFGRGPTITGVETPQDFSTNRLGARKTTAQAGSGPERRPNSARFALKYSLHPVAIFTKQKLYSALKCTPFHRHTLVIRLYTRTY